MGHEKAKDRVDKLLLSRTLEIVGEESILHEVGRMKCERAIALGDCHTVATAAKFNGTALFARAEDDLAKEMKKKPFSVKLLFLESHPVPLKSLKELRGALKEREKL